MMERLFAVQQQSSVFLLMLLCGIVLAFVLDMVRYARMAVRRGKMLLDVLPALALLASMLQAMAAGYETMRLYSLLGLVLGAAVYAAGLAPVVALTVRAMKKLHARMRQSRKSV